MGRLTLAQRLSVVRACYPELADRPAHRLTVEMMDVEIVLEGGRVPGMSEETRKRIEEAARYLEESA